MFPSPPLKSEFHEMENEYRHDNNKRMTKNQKKILKECRPNEMAEWNVEECLELLAERKRKIETDIISEES